VDVAAFRLAQQDGVLQERRFLGDVEEGLLDAVEIGLVGAAARAFLEERKDAEAGVLEEESEVERRLRDRRKRQEQVGVAGQSERRQRGLRRRPRISFSSFRTITHTRPSAPMDRE